MNCIEKFCPEALSSCFYMFFRHFGGKSSEKHKNELRGMDDFEQQQFQFSPSRFSHQEQKQTNLKKQIKDKKNSQEAEENLSVQLHLHNQQQQTSKLYQSESDQPEKLSHFNFKLNLEPYDQYYPVIESKTKDMQLIFGSNTKNILTRNMKSQTNIQQIETITGFKMIVTYRLPGTYAYFKSVNRDFQIVSALSSVISSNKIIQTIRPNLTIHQLSFRKFMLLEPRFFHYIKYTNSSYHYHWEVCTSIKGKPETEPTEKECQLTSISCFQERKKELLINTYLQVDLKSNLRANKVVLRVYQELAKYLDNLYDYMNQNFHEEYA